MKLKLRLLRIHKVVLLALTITLLCVVPVLSQVSYKATVSRIVETRTGVQLSQASQLNPTNNVNQLTQNIYTKIKPPGNPLPKIIIPLGTTDLNKFQNILASKKVSFRVIGINNNVPIISFASPDVALKDSISVDFIVDTGNSGLKSEQIGKAVEAKDYRLRYRREYANFQEYKGKVDILIRNTMIQQAPPRKVDYLVTISR